MNRIDSTFKFLAARKRKAYRFISAGRTGYDKPESPRRRAAAGLDIIELGVVSQTQFDGPYPRACSAPLKAGGSLGLLAKACRRAAKSPPPIVFLQLLQSIYKYGSTDSPTTPGRPS